MSEPRYSEDKPRSCKFCYFSQGWKHTCSLEQCYYLLPEEEKPTGCSACAYGRHTPCIGTCLVKNMQELKVGPYAK